MHISSAYSHLDINMSGMSACPSVTMEKQHYLDIYVSQGSATTHLRYAWKLGIGFVATLVLSPTVKELWKSANYCQSYERKLSGIFYYIGV